MRDYAELTEYLRRFANSYEQMFDEGKCSVAMKNAADAIEELLAAFCLLCGICTSPPSAETFYSCEIVRGCLLEPPKEGAE